MYTNLIGELAKAGVAYEAIAKLLGVHRNTVANKLYGVSPFMLDEAILIAKTYFPEQELQRLFRKQNRSA